MDRIFVPIAFVYALIGLMYILSKSLFSADLEIDLKYIWIAGQLWAEGINPYSEDFSRIGDSFFENTNQLDTWLYPPNWWVISRGLALFEIETAAVLWRSVNALLVAVGTVLVLQAFRPYLGQLWPVAGLMMFGYAATMQATAIVLSMGQTSIILYLGICALFFGLMRGQACWVVAGLVIVTLKPNIGIVVWAGITALPAQWRAIWIASLLTLVLCVPSGLAAGFGPTIVGLIGAYMDYDGALEVNAPANVTGLRHLAETVFGVEISAISMALFAALVAWLGVRVMRRRSTVFGDEHLDCDSCFWILLVIVTCVALHSYDFIILTPLWLVCFVGIYPRYLGIAIALGLLLVYRSGNLAEATGFQHPDTLYMLGSRIDSMVSLGMLCTFAAHTFLFKAGRLRPDQAR